MAEGGQCPLDEEESDEEIRSLVVLACTGEITLEQLKKKGDSKLRAKEYQKGFAIYSIALNCPIMDYTEVTIMAEQLYRKRAECLFKMGKYLEAIRDCEQAIAIAEENDSSSILVKSLFIKTTAIQNLGDYVNALPFAVWCKHLRPECERTKVMLNTVKDKLSEMFQNDYTVHEVLVTMVKFANEMEMLRRRPEVAVECYTETLEILYFMFLPGVLFCRARSLLKLGRHKEAKNDCARVLDIESNNEKALLLMKQITDAMRKTETTVAKEKAVPQECLPKETKLVSHMDSVWSDSVEPFRCSLGDQRQCAGKEEKAASGEVEGFEEQAELDQKQVQDDASEESAKLEKKRRRNKQKRLRKKEKKKEQKKKKNALDQQMVSKTSTSASSTEADKNESDEMDSETDESSVTEEPAVSIMNSVTERPSLIEEPAVSIPCSVNNKMGGSLSTLSSTFRNSVLCEDPFADDFIPVQNSRRPRKKAVKISSIAQDRVQESFSPEIEAKRQQGDISSQENTVPQHQQMIPRGALEIQKSTNQRKSEIPSQPRFYLEEFPLLDGSVLKSAHEPVKAPNAPIKPPPPATMPTLKCDQQSRMSVSSEKRSSPSVQAFSYLSSSGITASHTTGVDKDYSRQPFLPVTLSQRFQSVGQLNEMSGPSRIPQGVVVVCHHFLQDNSTEPSSVHSKVKTCKGCENTGLMRFAVWSATHCRWQLMRPYPALMVPFRATLSVCRHFETLRPCPKDPCTFPHGTEESALWEMEREGALPTPQEVLALAAATAVNTNLPVTEESSSSLALSSARQLPSKDNDALQTTDLKQQQKACFSMASLEEFPRLGTALSNGSSDDATRNMSSSVCPKGSDSSKTALAASQMVESNMAAPQWAQASNFNNAPFRPRCSSQPKMCELKPTTPEFIPAKETYANSLMKDSNLNSTERFTTADNVNSASSSAGGTKPLTHIFDTSTADSKSVPSSDMVNVEINQQTPSNKFTKIPDGVFVVCDDFLQKNLRLAKSIREKTKACKGCENRSKLKYAFWSNNNRQWQIIRQYPEKVPSHVAFSVCRQYATNTPCLRTPCSFAHGQEELDMWTLEREGVLPSPRETLTGLPEKSNERSIHMQPQLKYRPSPPGVKGGAFKLCRSCYTHERCRFGRGCLYAHSNGELMEWQQEYLRKGREKLKKELQDKDEVLSMEMTTNILKGPEEDVVESLPGVDVSCNPPELSVKLLENNGKATCQWVFNLTFKTSVVGYLRHVLLLYRYHNCYQLSEIRVGCYQDYRGCESYNVCYSAKLKEFWYKAPDVNNFSGRAKVSLTVSFESSLYGSFDQCIVFDFGRKPYLVRRLNVDVQSGSLPQTSIFSQHATATAVWDERSMDVVRFVHKTGEALQGEHLSRIYSLQKQGNITAEELRRDNYKTVMHQLLFVEEGFMKRELSSYTLGRTQLHAQWSVFDDMSGMKFAVDNELFGVLYLKEEDALRPDDAAGRLLYRNVSSVWLQLADSVSNKVYEAPVEKVESECVVLRLSSKTVSDLLLYDTCDVSVNAQFQLNRWPVCEMHAAIDRITTAQLRLIFPEPRVPVVRSEVTIRWRWLLDKRLNNNQKEVIKQIASPEYNSPPLVVFGPFGTGKTFTLNQAVRLLVQLDKSHRILLCTHSNRAADIHVELLHKYLTEQNGTPAARPLRIYQPMRRLETTSEIARNYCLTKGDMFVLPSRDDLVEHRVVVTTLSTSQVLLDLKVLHGFFTHILIDEAAQALEPEALTPLIYAGPNTKVVFTGDHMQMSPEVYSPEARRLGLQKSLAERLFDIYDKHEAQEVREYYVLFLTENYRCHPDILKFPSDNFYGEKLLARGGTSQLAHPKYGPLLFFSARGKEYKEHDNSYVNLSEVYEVVKRVKEVAHNWPTRTWGPTKLSDIAVLSAYRYQVQTIRNSLRKEVDLKDVKVDTIHNVQGNEQFSKIRLPLTERNSVHFLSAPCVHFTCKPQQEDVRAGGSDRPLYWEFLSDPKLLNTAVTRARCLVAVVGDPVSLCTVGECRSIWRDYIKRCNEKGGLYGVTMEELDKEINAAIAGIELNPKAEPFVPKALSIPEKSVTTEVGETGKVHDSKEIAEETQKDKNDGKDGKEKGQEISDKSDAKLDEDSLNVNDQCHNGRFINTSPDVNQETNKVDGVDEKEDEERIVEPGDFQDDLLDDETVSPRDLDEIILAFVKKCEETLQSDAARLSMFQDCEFPPLEATGSKAIRPQTDANRSRFSNGGREELKEFFPEIHVINGRVEVHLTNLRFYSSPSERAQRIIASTKQQEFLDPSVLRQLLSDEPDKYKVCNLRLNPEKSQVGYAEIEDTETPDIEIKGRVRQAFDRDKVVLELIEKRTRSNADSEEFRFQGKVVGVLEHIISPHERQFVCTTDYRNPALMLPINKSAPKLVNLSDKSCKDIPIYRKDQNNRAVQVKMIEREKVLSGKYLFVVKYLQWKREFCYPLGIIVRMLPRGEDFKSSLEIAYAERGIRRVFKDDAMKYVKEKFPPQWLIPENEYATRTRIEKAFTIDPPTSLDLDDALTIESISLGTFRVGIHIADVSFFVTPDSPLDNEAFLRCTSYYPGEGQKNLPMLPNELSEGHCSLLPDKDRLAVSVFITLDKDGNVTDEPKIQRTIVRSCCRLSYAEAQMIIDKREIGSKQVAKDIVDSVRQLNGVAQMRRRHRLGDESFDHWQNEESGEYFEAHELVEEMMILANEEVAKLLSRKCPELALLRVQLPPKDLRLAEWVERHGRYVRLSLQLSGIFRNSTSDEASSLALLHSDKTMFKIQRWVWDGICQAAELKDLPTLRHLICHERNHPQIAAAQSQFRRIQSQSRYVCEGDQPSANIQHFSLGIRSYTHFTSPIRRYIDIAVHRLLLGLESPRCHKDNISKDDMKKVCRRSTFLTDNQKRFGKDCKRIRLATTLQQQCHVTRVFIESIEKQSISLYICNPEDDHLAGKQKRMFISDMNPVALTEEEFETAGEKCLVLTWKIRRYIAPDGLRNVKEESNTVLSGQTGVQEIAEIPSDMWIQVLDTVRANDIDKLPGVIKQMEARLSIMSPSSTEMKRTQHTLPENTRGDPYKHPHYGEKTSPSSSEANFHFYEMKLALRKYHFLSVQLCPHMTRGILQPDIQMVNLNPYLNICIEHRKYPRESFAHTARHQASREQYKSIDEYINAWKPVLAMEAATEAVKENDGFVIEHLSVEWEKEDESLTGSFTLTLVYCKNRQVEFYPGDLVCVRVPCPPKECCSFEKQGQQQSCSSRYSHQGSFWVSHCIIDEVIEVKKEKVEVTMKYHQAASNIPAEITHGGSHRCTLELIHRTLPQRRMYAALCVNLRHSSELVHAICKGEEPKRETFGSLPPNLSLEQHGFKRLNHYQEAAVKEALSNPFSLIQGPPGTGKTVTGVHIAYWFSQRNQRLAYKVLEKGKRKKEDETAYRAPPQLIYCGPSNKAVDVVTEYLMKIPSLKILRVYSDQIEQKEFPIPNKLKPARITRSEDELKMSSEKIRSVSLHHLIRSGVCPYAEELRRFEEGFAEDKARGEPISEDVDKYCRLIGQAERWAMQESGVQIILCTCATAGSPRIANSCDNIQQCIVDECGMCLEPESLVPITSSRARQVVLIGDHKQLQPVIQDQVAKALGLSVSMFERHSKRARMLQLQYRMHKGICEFPSKEFYDDKLQTAEVVNSRPRSPVSFWPAQVRRRRDLPIVFCHVEGQEESSVITTSESNQESKRNMKEVRKVVQVAKYLVNRDSVRKSDVVILSPYREQRSKISELLRGAYDDIHVTTITKSQGSEWDYVIMSLVRSLKKEEIDPEPSLSWLGEHLGFLRDEHQMNVGLTRARRGLCIIGNKNLLGMDEMWSKLIEHYENNHCLVDESWPWT